MYDCSVYGDASQSQGVYNAARTVCGGFCCVTTYALYPVRSLALQAIGFIKRDSKGYVGLVYRYALSTGTYYRSLYVSHSALVEVAVGLLSLNIVCCVCKSHIASFGREIAELRSTFAPRIVHNAKATQADLPSGSMAGFLGSLVGDDLVDQILAYAEQLED